MSMLAAANKSTTVANMLTAAEELFVARAYSDVTIDEVASAAHVTKGAVYHHFSSKEELYLAMLHEDLERKRSLFREAAALSGSCEQRLRELTQAFLSLPATKRNLIALVRRDVNIFEAKTREVLVQAYQQALPEQVERIIRDGIRDQDIMPSDPRLLAWHFVALVEVVLTPYADKRFACDEDKINHVMSLFLGGCSRTHTKEYQ